MAYTIIHPDIDGEPRLIPEHALSSYAARGWVLADPERDLLAPRALPVPPRNASAPVWRTYAVALRPENGGLTVTEAFARTRDELADTYHPSTSKPKAAPVAETPKES